MSNKSKEGTRTTSSFIDQDSARYIDRSCLGQSKRGSLADNTDAAHIFSFGLYNAMGTHMSGRPRTNVEELYRDLNHSDNLRIKSKYGNATLDERRDARIADAFVNGHAIYGNSTAFRAHRAYESASQFTTLDAHAEALGSMRIYNPQTGGYYQVKNYHKYN